MVKIKYLLWSLAACFLLASCSGEPIEQSLPENNGWHTASLKMNLSLSHFDGATKAADGWHDADVVYLLFTTDGGKVTGKATYSDSEAAWTVNYYGTLQRDSEASVSVWYFDGSATVTSQTVALTPATGIFADASGKYLFPSGGDLVVTGNLTPQTGRIRFKGTSGTQIQVGGLSWNASLDLAKGTFTSSNEEVPMQVGSDGYTPYIYASFADTDKRTLTVVNGDTFSAECPATVLQTGKSGWMDIPTADACNGWNRKDRINGHEYVDLGLPSGLLWATCNVGATSPEDYGDYFAWGETSPKNSFSWSNLKYCLDSNGNRFSKYVASSSYGTVDNKMVLEPEDDAAQVNWGGSWRMPTQAEFQELIDKCTWTWTTMNGKNGYKVVSKVNGSSLFFPAAGYRSGTSLSYAGSYGYYWSSSLDESYSYGAGLLYFNSGDRNVGYNDRCYGQSVRPVCH